MIYYLKRNSKFEKIFKEKDIKPISELSLMNCIHPDLYQLRVEESEKLSQSILKLRKLTISGLIKNILPKFLVEFIKDIRSKI